MELYLFVKLALVREFVGDSARRTGVYKDVHEDSSTDNISKELNQTNEFKSELNFSLYKIGEFNESLKNSFGSFKNGK